MKNGKQTKVSKNGSKKPTTKAAKKTAKGGKTPRFFIFELPASRVIHRLGELKPEWTPAKAIKAIHSCKGCAAMSVNAIRNMLYSGRNKTAKQVAKLSKTQIATLTKLAA